jgi:iron complex outermembrane receptor protein
MTSPAIPAPGLGACLLVAISLLSNPAQLRAADLTPVSPTVIEEIVVTSEFRQKTVDRTPASVSVVSLDEQRGQALNHLEDVLAQVPNVNFAGGSSRARHIQIRGIGERSQQEEPLNSSVGMLIDGVDFSGIGTVALLHDVDQVEVLRGPQGTLYGANALAGLIHVRTNEPTPTFEGAVRLDAGNYDARGVGVVLSGPLTDTLAGRLAVKQYQDDGFIKNTYLHRSDTNNRDELTVRGRLSWSPLPALDLDLSLGFMDVDNGYDAFSLDNDRHSRSDEPGQDAQESRFAGLSADWAINDAVTFQGNLGYAVSDIDYGYDEDWTYVGFHPWEYSSTDRYLRDRDTATIDLRLVSGPNGKLLGDTMDWVVGLYGLHQAVDFTREYTFFDQPFSSDFEVDRVAMYGELSRGFGSRARLTLGLRGERHESRYSDSDAARFSPSDDLWGGRLVFEWSLDDLGDLGYLGESMFYASASRGYKAGGFNPSNSLDVELRQFDPETLWNFELGLKGRWFDQRLGGRFALFSMQREDVQIGTSIIQVRPDGSSEFIQLISNAASGINNGLEAELTFSVTPNLQVFGNLGLLYTRFEDFVNTAGEDLDGEDQAHAPSYNFYTGADYQFGQGFYLHVEVEGKDRFYYSDSRRFADNAEDLISKSSVLVNASVGIDREHWDLRLWGRNLTDQDYVVRGFYFPNDPRDGYTERGWYQFGDPLRYGMTLNLKF